MNFHSHYQSDTGDMKVAKFDPSQNQNP